MIFNLQFELNLVGAERDEALASYLAQKFQDLIRDFVFDNIPVEKEFSFEPDMTDFSIVSDKLTPQRWEFIKWKEKLVNEERKTVR